jgi:hypothetical protein
LDWSLENRPMLAQLPSHAHWLYVSYEDLVAQTRGVVDYLADRLQLADRQRMVDRAAKPSRSTRRESTAERQRLVRQQDRDRLLSSWQTALGADQLRACCEVLDRFGIDLYRPDSCLPDHARVGRQGFG